MYEGCAPMSFEASALGGLALSALALPGLASGPGVGGTNVVVDVIGTAVVLGVDGAAVALITEGVAVALDVDVADVGTSTAPAFASANR